MRDSTGASFSLFSNLVSNESSIENEELNAEETEINTEIQPEAEPIQKITEVKIGNEDESAEESYKT